VHLLLMLRHKRRVAGPPDTNTAEMPELGSLPEFPDFAPLAAEHKSLVEACLRAAAPVVSELTFAYQWCWLPHTRCRLARLEGALMLMAVSTQSARAYLLPPVTPDADLAAALIPRALRALAGGAADAFARVPEVLVERLPEPHTLNVVEEPERADYVHAADELRQLPGGTFRQKRQQVARFWEAMPAARVLDLDEALAPGCVEFCRDWLRSHPRADLPGLQREVAVAVRMLENHAWLGLKGTVLAEGDRVLAFALGEPLNPETFVERIEKADAAVPGAYQAVCQQFALHAARGYRWINREQDLGLPGLRKAKRSYNPSHMVHKYRISLR